MKKFIFLLLALNLQAQPVLRQVNNINELLILNPYDIHTNYLVSATGQIMAFNRTNTASTNLYSIFKPIGRTGRWEQLGFIIRSLPSSNYVPYRASLTNLGDSPILRKSSTNVYIPTVIIGSDPDWYGASDNPQLTGRLDISQNLRPAIDFTAYAYAGIANPNAFSFIMQENGAGNRDVSYSMFVENDVNSRSINPANIPTDGSIAGWFDANSSGVNQIGVVGSSRGSATNNIGVLAITKKSLANRTNIALMSQFEVGSSQTQVGHYIDAGYVNTTPNTETSMLLIDNRGSGYPFIIARRDNGVKQAILDPDGALILGSGLTNHFLKIFIPNYRIFAVNDGEIIGSLIGYVNSSLGTNKGAYVLQTASDIGAQLTAVYYNPTNGVQGSLVNIGALSGDNAFVHIGYTNSITYTGLDPFILTNNYTFNTPLTIPADMLHTRFMNHDTNIVEIFGDGSVSVSGKLTATGGIDPPYVLYDAETRLNIKNRVKKEVPVIKQTGAAMFFNPISKRIELYMPSENKFYSLGELQEIKE